jgi:predicted HicB family RNase H-like nuclease
MTKHPARAPYGATPIPLQIRVSEELDRQLREGAQRDGVTVAEYARRLLTAALSTPR